MWFPFVIVFLFPTKQSHWNFTQADACERESHALSSSWTRKVPKWMLDLQVGPTACISYEHLISCVVYFRVRRVKCDETKPYCRRCIASGRRCEGPLPHRFLFVQDLPTTAEAPTFLPEISLIAPQRSYEERWAFNYFVHRAAPLFAGAIDATFWLDLVPRLAQAHPFVWDTVVSISWLFEHVPYRLLTTTFDTSHRIRFANSHHRRALKWYTRAVAGFRQRLEENEMDSAHALLSCVLFASIEFQQRSVGNGLLLVQSGCKILKETLFPSTTKGLPTMNLDVHEVVVPFISRHAVLTATLSTPLPPGWSNPAEENILVSSELSSLPVLDGVRRQLCNLMYSSYEVIRVTVLLNNDDHELKKLKPQQQMVLKALNQWKKAFSDRWSHEMNSHIRWLSSNLLMYWNLCYIWLSSCTNPLQTAFDDYEECFAAIITHAEEVLRYTAESTHRRPTFAFEIRVVLPLYFAAIKCRHPTLRRKALRLMRQAPEQESLWPLGVIGCVIEKVISLEEDSEPTCFSEMSLPSEGFPLPPEARRIHHVAVIRKEVHEDSQHLKLQVTRLVLNTDGSRNMVHEDFWHRDYTTDHTRL